MHTYILYIIIIMCITQTSKEHFSKNQTAFEQYVFRSFLLIIYPFVTHRQRRLLFQIIYKTNGENNEYIKSLLYTVYIIYPLLSRWPLYPLHYNWLSALLFDSLDDTRTVDEFIVLIFLVPFFSFSVHQ